MNNKEKLMCLLMAVGMPDMSLAKAETIADYLVSKNVIVIPCKLGDTVWVVNKTMGCVHPAKFRLDDLDQIGRRVFLTKAEAEKFLKGGKKR